jgi:WD40 repeat protein
VVYWSAASDLGSGDQRDCGVFQASGPDPISCADIFIYDRRFRSTTRLPIGRRIESYFSTTNIPLDISSDGRWLITNVRATDQIARDLHITSSPSLYLFDLENQEAVAINVAPDGTPGNGPSFDASISADGRFVAFSSQASNLIPDDTNRVIDVFVLDRDTGEVSRISERADGSELSVESGVVHPGRYWTGGGLDISGNGEWVIYTSNSDDLADPSKVDCGFPLNCQNVYITNRLSRQTYQLNYSNVDSLPFTSLTDQGELGVFMAHSPPCDLEEFCSDLYLYNRLVNETYRLGGYGSMPGLASFKPSLRGDSFVHSLHSNRVTSVSFSPDQQMIASGSWDGLVKLVSTETNDQVGTLVGNQRPVNAVEFSPGGELLAAAYEGNEIYIWRQPEQNLAGVLPGFPGVRSLSFSPDEEFLAMGGTGGIWLWYLKDGFLEDTLEIPEGRINALSYSPDGRMLAAASDDNTVWVWKLPDKKLILRLGGHTENVNAVAFSADSNTIASGSNDGTINVWKINKSDIRNLNPVLLYTFDHGDWVTSLDFSRDGRRLVSGSFDSSIAVWDLDDPGMLSLLFDDTQNQILSVEISPDGNQLAAGTVRGEVHFWKDLLLLEEFK